MSRSNSTPDLANIKHIPDNIPDMDEYDIARSVGILDCGDSGVVDLIFGSNNGVTSVSSASPGVVGRSTG